MKDTIHTAALLVLAAVAGLVALAIDVATRHRQPEPTLCVCFIPKPGQAGECSHCHRLI